MSYGVYGSGRLLEKCCAYLKDCGFTDACCITDRVEDVELSRSFPGFESCNLSEAASFDAVILVPENAWISVAVRRLKAAGVTSMCYLPAYYAEEGREIGDESFIWPDLSLPRLEYLEYHVSWHCNLKCRGCTHFSNIIEGERFGDIDAFVRDMQRLQELFWGIFKIRLMGGEPLLNPKLPEFVAVSREAFPDADIRVVSNALLLREDMEDLLDTMGACGVGFDVSMYPPTKAAIGRVDGICRKKGVKLFVTPEVREFRAGMDPEGRQEPGEVYAACPARHCAFLGDGVISTCAMPQLIDIYNGCFGQNIPVVAEDIIDLYEPGLTGEELLRRLHSPMDICRFCTQKQRSFPWEPAPRTTAEAGDWWA
ncbi:MAG: radical SAM protein [Lachnospiraceae bacterium]|nr:radical SAM protein [Lachnospiraceae bacterium]